MFILMLVLKQKNLSPAPTLHMPFLAAFLIPAWQAKSSA